MKSFANFVKKYLVAFGVMFLSVPCGVLISYLLYTIFPLPPTRTQGSWLECVISAIVLGLLFSIFTIVVKKSDNKIQTE